MQSCLRSELPPYSLGYPSLRGDPPIVYSGSVQGYLYTRPARPGAARRLFSTLKDRQGAAEDGEAASSLVHGDPHAPLFMLLSARRRHALRVRHKQLWWHPGKSRGCTVFVVVVDPLTLPGCLGLCEAIRHLPRQDAHVCLRFPSHLAPILSPLYWQVCGVFGRWPYH